MWHELSQVIIRYYCLFTGETLRVSVSVHRDAVSHLAQLDLAAGDCKVRFISKHALIVCDGLRCSARSLCLSQAAKVTAVHVASCQDEFRQQQMAVLWRASGASHAQVNGTQTKLRCTVLLLFDQCVCVCVY